MSKTEQTIKFIPGGNYMLLLIQKNIFSPILDILTSLNESKEGLFENLRRFIESPVYGISKIGNEVFTEQCLKTIYETYDLGNDLKFYSPDCPIALMLDWVVSEISTDVGDSIKTYMQKPFLINFRHPPVKFTIMDMQNFSKNMPEILVKYLDKSKFKEVVKITKATICLEDFTSRRSLKKIDAYRKIFHTRSEATILYLEDLKNKFRGENDDKESEDIEFDIELEQLPTDDEATGWSFTESFLSSLDSKDRRIVEMRMLSFSYQEIADELGFKTHSAVIKRLLKLEDKLRNFAGEDFHLDSYLKPEFRKK